ncbi:hypothetical protein [Nostoc sp.]|uniref:hypothetical protein n=1 Tax=Nostoc sp. TaxID=1180 RepID=UPI002FFA636F
MEYSDFTLEKVSAVLGITTQEADLFPKLVPLSIPSCLNDVEAGLGQCIAQMVTADLFNRSSGQTEIPVYGCVTTREVWQFLQLSQKVALLDQQRYYLDNVGAILAIVQTIVQQFSS